MPGVWLPFEGFVLPDRWTPFFVKPETTDTNDEVDDYFPDRTAKQLHDWADEKNNNGRNAHYWGRFKNIKCLYTSCLLTPPSNKNITAAIRLAASLDTGSPHSLEIREIIPNKDFSIEEESRYTIKLNKDIAPDDVTNLNEILLHMGYQTQTVNQNALLEVPLDYIRMSQKDIENPLTTTPPPFSSEKIFIIEQQINSRYVEPSVKPHITSMSITPTSAQSTAQAWYDCSQCFGKKENKEQTEENLSKDGATTHNPMQR
ncbi:MAG: hypothetical protein CK423_09465 [Legionella sp.]|nr:MAG: hypothetical protein CK423_09465 [Legionella sp.]